jgi:NADPH-dependent curcumin reductase CurA
MNGSLNRQVWLRSRPTGIPRASDFGLREVEVPTIEHGAFLVRNEFLRLTRRCGLDLRSQQLHVPCPDR